MYIVFLFCHVRLSASAKPSGKARERSGGTRPRGKPRGKPPDASSGPHRRLVSGSTTALARWNDILCVS